MIKRLNKTTSLLIAAAAIISLVPATGVNAATRLNTKEGNVYKAVAFDGGKYIYDGYMTDDDDNGLYFNNGTKDNYLGEDYSFDGVKYGSKYATLKDSNDEYLLDLSTGKVLDDETIEDSRENTEIKLKSTLRKVDRYATNANGKIEFENGDKIDQINDGQFGDVWYTYAVKNADDETKTCYGFVNEAGKYVDASASAEMTVAYTKEDGTKDTVKVTEYDKAKNDVTVSLNSIEAFAQDKDYIYTATTVSVKVGDQDQGTRQYIQKISKTQGDTKDDAYLPKSVSSYEVSQDYKIDGDAEDIVDANNALAGLFTDSADTTCEFRVIKGMIYVTNIDGDKVYVTTVNLKKQKVTVGEDKNTLDVYVAVKNDDNDQKIQDSNETAVSIDADGNTWALYKGTIYKFNGSEFVEVYNCDRTLNSLDVYNEDNLIAWNEDEEIFTTVQAEDVTDPEKPTTGWVQAEDGSWTYNKEDGTKATGWIQTGNWYYLNLTTGVMQTGWVNDNGTWYFCNASGAMQTGWIQQGSTWYFCNASGAMQTGWLYNNGTWYYLNSNGSMKTGWLNDNGTWYYLNANGSMAVNTTVDGCKLGANGAWVK